jgi:hypothetical protein
MVRCICEESILPVCLDWLYAVASEARSADAKIVLLEAVSTNVRLSRLSCDCLKVLT